MDRDTARKELKARLTDYVNMITKPDRKAGRNMYKCPLCGSGNHNSPNSDGAFSITQDGEKWHCFSCGQGGDIFDLIGKYAGIEEHNEQFKFAAELFNISADQASQKTELKPKKKEDAAKPEEKKPEPGQFKEYIEKCAAAAGKTNYYTLRGLSNETVKRFNLGYDEEKKAIVIPYDRTNSYYITRLLRDKRDSKDRVFDKPPTEKAGNEPIYNLAALYSGKNCFVCESQLDAISIMQAGGNAVAIGGSGLPHFLKELKEKKPTNTLILCFDNDRVGKQNYENCSAELKELGISFIISSFSLDQYSGERKDANDLLRANEEQLRIDVRRNVKAAWRKDAAFTPYRVSDYLNSGTFETDIAYFKRYQNRKTGFANIDQHLTLYPGLAALGGSASLGKSTFAVNLADNLIAMGETVLYFALEQDPIELVTKSIARRLYNKDPYTPISNIDIKNGAKSAMLEEVKREYAEAAADRFIIVRCDFTTTAEDIRDYVEAFIKETGKRPAVFIDYLQLISPPADFRGDVRTGTDHIVKLFKTMQIDNELFVCMISNFNRNSYAVPVSYEAFKETSMIEFTCDYVWGLQLSVLEDESFYSKEGKQGGEKETNLKAKRDAIYQANTQNPKEVEFVSLKSRNGKQSYKCFFRYYMAHDIFVPDLNSPHDKENNTLRGFTQLTADEENIFFKMPAAGIKTR